MDSMMEMSETVEANSFDCPKQTSKDPLLQLVSLQKASGCWLLNEALASALGKTSEEMEKSKPAPVGHCEI